jgi:WD40-like Beta Propeller Repeat
MRVGVYRCHGALRACRRGCELASLRAAAVNRVSVGCARGADTGYDRNSGVGLPLMPAMGWRAVALAVAVAAIGMCAPPAWAAFPGRDGKLVVATGNGLELVAPVTGTARSICGSTALCGHPAQPSFSPNGRAIAFVDTVSHRPVVIAADGSCLWCLVGRPLTTVTGGEPAFTPGGEGITVARNGLWRVSLTGGGARRIVRGLVHEAVWSSRRLVAMVRAGWVWVGRPGHGPLRRLARGGSPSFSPNGAMLAVARDGFVWIVRLADGSARRLVRGGAPAWSPSGERIAYIAAGGRVEIVAIHGGRSRQVGSVRATALDWQPLARPARPACTPPRGSTVLASSRDAVVFSRGRLVVYGCLNALGRTRLLLDGRTFYLEAVIAVRIAGRFAAVETMTGKTPEDADEATLYDLSSGTAIHLAAVPLQPAAAVASGLDSLALDSSGFAAWRQTTGPAPVPITAVSCPSVSLCVAGDAAGNILTSTNPTGGPTAWSSAPVPVRGISCPTISLCVAGEGGYILTSADPAGGASAWMKTTIDQGSVGAVSCPSVSLCVAAGTGAGTHGGAIILTSTDPTAGTSSWIGVPVTPGDEFVSAVSCPSPSLCVATTFKGDIFTSTNPTGGASAWTRTTIDHGNLLAAVSCPSLSLCVAVDYTGILTSTNPTGSASAWTKTTTIGHATIPVSAYAVSCPSVSLCVAGGIGNVLTSTDPAGGASTWTKTAIDREDGIYAISCPSVSMCVATGSNGNILTSTNPTGGTNAWTSAAVDVPGCPPTSTPCISEQLYVHDDRGTRVLDTAPPGDGNSIGNVVLGGDSRTLTWAHDGAKRGLKLR